MSSNTDREQFYEKITEQIDEPQLLDLGTDLNFTKYALNYFDVLTIVQIYQETRLQFLELMQFAKQNRTRHSTLAPNEPGMRRADRPALQDIVESPGVIEARIQELYPEFVSGDTRLIILYPELVADINSYDSQVRFMKRLCEVGLLFPKQTLICGQQVYSGFSAAYTKQGFAVDVRQINPDFVALHTLMH